MGIAHDAQRAALQKFLIHMRVHMAGTALLPVAAVLTGIIAAQRVLVRHLAGRFGAEFIGDQHAVRIEQRLVDISAFLHQAYEKGAGAVMQSRKIHGGDDGFPRMHRIADLFTEDLFR